LRIRFGEREKGVRIWLREKKRERRRETFDASIG
jgi:hypothetical protein